MRHIARPATILLLVVALMAALAGCVANNETGTGELTSDESPVPGGMPVMYEFYTTT